MTVLFRLESPGMSDAFRQLDDIIPFYLNSVQNTYLHTLHYTTTFDLTVMSLSSYLLHFAEGCRVKARIRSQVLPEGSKIRGDVAVNLLIGIYTSLLLISPTEKAV